MTRVQLRFSLQKPLDQTTMSRLDAAHSIYGILRIQIDPALDGLTVEYDATRLRPDEVEAELSRAGISAQRQPAA